MYGLKDEIIKNIKHEGFNNIKFNSLNDELILTNEKNENNIINLKGLRLSYEEIQKIKKALTNASFNWSEEEKLNEYKEVLQNKPEEIIVKKIVINVINSVLQKYNI